MDVKEHIRLQQSFYGIDLSIYKINFDFGHNQIPSFKDLNSNKVKGALDCRHNQITSFKDLTLNEFEGYLDCGYNQITSFKDLVIDGFKGNLDCNNNPIRDFTGLIIKEKIFPFSIVLDDFLELNQDNVQEYIDNGQIKYIK